MKQEAPSNSANKLSKFKAVHLCQIHFQIFHRSDQ